MNNWKKREMRKRNYVIERGIDEPAIVEMSTQFRCPRCWEVVCDDKSILEERENKPEIIHRCPMCGQLIEWPERVKYALFKY